LGKGGFVRGTAEGAGFLLGLVLPNKELERRQVQHLAFFDGLGGLISQRCAAIPALLNPVQMDLVGVVYYFKSVARMPFLGAAFLAALWAQAFSPGKTIPGRGFAAVFAVGVELAFQFFDSRRKDGELGKQCLYQGQHHIWPLIIEGLDLLRGQRRSPPGRLLARGYR
jgi:hypothetical protein